MDNYNIMSLKHRANELSYTVIPCIVCTKQKNKKQSEKKIHSYKSKIQLILNEPSYAVHNNKSNISHPTEKKKEIDIAFTMKIIIKNHCVDITLFPITLLNLSGEQFPMKRLHNNWSLFRQKCSLKYGILYVTSPFLSLSLSACFFLFFFFSLALILLSNSFH